MIDQVALRYGWTYEQVGKLTKTQVHLMFNEGKDPSRGTQVLPGNIAQLAQERRRLNAVGG